MEQFTTDVIGDWETEGGATLRSDAGPHFVPSRLEPGTAAKTALAEKFNQVECAQEMNPPYRETHWPEGAEL